MMQLCTFTKLLFFQNNISRKLLFILARMINSLGLCLKNVSKLIDAFVTSSIYFDVQKFPYLSKIYISAITWDLLEKRIAGYNPTSRQCRLCLLEKFHIMFTPGVATLNKRREIYTPCMHRDKLTLGRRKKKAKQ